MEVTFHALPSLSERAGFLNLPTSFNLPDDDVDRLRDVAKRILYSQPDFPRLVRDLGGTLPGLRTERVTEPKP